MPRWLSRTLILALALLGAGPPAPQASAAQAACLTFPETGLQVCDRFLAYWQANGGLAQQGLPLTDVFDEVNLTNGQIYKTQYFERARFELHPENAAPYDVLLGLLGREQLRARYPGGAPDWYDDIILPTCVRFAETGAMLCGEFLVYWQEHGGLAQQGFPLTNRFMETNPTDGKRYLTQYFERARFEYHPENTGTPYVVLLGLLGREQYEARYRRPKLPDDDPPIAPPSPCPGRDCCPGC